MSNTDVLDMHFKKPDKYKTLKISFSQILKNNNKDLTLSIINDALFRVNKIVIHTYQFLRLFNLSTNQIIGKDDKFLELTVNVIGIAMKLFIKTTKRGRKIVGKNKLFLERSFVNTSFIENALFRFNFNFKSFGIGFWNFFFMRRSVVGRRFVGMFGG